MHSLTSEYCRILYDNPTPPPRPTFRIYEDSPEALGRNVSQASNSSVAEEDELYVISPQANQANRTPSPSPRSNRSNRTRSAGPNSNRAQRQNFRDDYVNSVGSADFSGFQDFANRISSTPNVRTRKTISVTKTSSDGSECFSIESLLSNEQETRGASPRGASPRGASPSPSPGARRQANDSMSARVNRMTVGEARALLPASLAQHVLEMLTAALQAGGAAGGAGGTEGGGVVAIPLNMPAIKRSLSADSTATDESGENETYSTDESLDTTPEFAEDGSSADEPAAGDGADEMPVLLLVPAPRVMDSAELSSFARRLFGTFQPGAASTPNLPAPKPPTPSPSPAPPPKKKKTPPPPRYDQGPKRSHYHYR